jgi:hypothetical protein
MSRLFLSTIEGGNARTGVGAVLLQLMAPRSVALSCFSLSCLGLYWQKCLRSAYSALLVPHTLH